MRARQNGGGVVSRVATIGSLFSGIGGLELGVEHATGARTLWQVERESFCRDVLAKHWPDAVRYDDVCTVNGLPRVDIICGGFPCQDVSLAGKRAGFSGERSSLWREYRRIVADVRPRYVLVENVPGLLTADDGWAFGEVLGDLAALGFDATWDVFRASDVGAPHRRDRLFILAHASRVDAQRRGGAGLVGRAEGEEQQRGRDAASRGGQTRKRDRRPGKPSVGLSPYGVPRRLDDHRWPAGRGEAQHSDEPPRTATGVVQRAAQLKALGNAVVPQVAALAWRVLYDRTARRQSEAA